MTQEFYPPEVGKWYRQSSGKGQLFEVIAIDNEGCHIEIQFFDGNLDHLEMDIWLELEVLLEEAPENCLGAYDVPEVDDIAGHITDTTLEDWLYPFSELSLDDENIIIIEREADHISWNDDLLH